MESDVVADVDMVVNENEIFIEEKSEERVKESKTSPSSHSENEDNMRIILKNLHEQTAKWKPHGKNSPT
jgi:hypothetical protein